MHKLIHRIQTHRKSSAVLAISEVETVENRWSKSWEHRLDVIVFPRDTHREKALKQISANRNDGTSSFPPFHHILFDTSYDKPPNLTVPACRTTIFRTDETRCVRTNPTHVIPPLPPTSLRPSSLPRSRRPLLSDAVCTSLFVTSESNVSGQWIHWKLSIIHVTAVSWTDLWQLCLLQRHKRDRSGLTCTD
jgi:hypothetical protein